MDTMAALRKLPEKIKNLPSSIRQAIIEYSESNIKTKNSSESAGHIPPEHVGLCRRLLHRRETDTGCLPAEG